MRLTCNHVSKWFMSALLWIASGAFMALPLWGQSSYAETKAWIEFGGLELSSDGEKWMVVSIQITPKKHPNAEGAFNKKYIDDVKIEVYLCFKNRSKEKKILRETKRRPELRNVLDFYHAEFEILTMEVSPLPRTLLFLLPLEIAQRDGFAEVKKPYGQVVDISIGGVSIQDGLMKGAKNRSSKPITFGNYRDESILQSFKQEAIANSARTEGILLSGVRKEELLLTPTQQIEIMLRMAGFPKKCGTKSSLTNIRRSSIVPRIRY